LAPRRRSGKLSTRLGFEREIVSFDWRMGLPVLRGPAATLREPRLADAGALFARLTSSQVARFISTPPSSVVGFERFITWVQNERRSGRHVCYAIVPNDADEAVGLIQVREIEAGFGTAEWGFALSEDHWGTGLFMSTAVQVLDFAFQVMKIHRMEARASVSNGRGNGVLQKLGAVPEGILRQAFSNDALRTDQILWAIISNDWLDARPDPFDFGEPCVQEPEAAPARAHLRALPSWRQALPVLQGDGVTLRELEHGDAETLAALFADPDVGRYIPPPPATRGDFERFIGWAQSQRQSGTILCFGVVPEGATSAVGILQLHELEPPFRTAEWGFVFGRPYWGTGLFERGAKTLLGFAFDTVGVHRLEARAMAANARANAVLRRLGATEEGHLRRSFLLGGQYHDDVLWAMLNEDWRARRT
jgi:[ribosomal protein S5]-alanine N-acetyltransferase